jgi:O-antigen/teichoic acid export membrane protein
LERSLRAIAAKGVRWTTLSALAAIGAQLLQLYIATQIVSPEELGLFAIVLLVLGLLRVFADGGFDFGILHRQQMSPEELASVYWISVAVGTGLYGAAALVGAPLVAWAYGEPRLHTLVSLGALSYMMVPFGLMYGTLLRKHLRFQAVATIEICAAVAGPLGTLAAAWAGYKVAALIFGLAAANVVRSGLLILIGGRSWRPSLYLSFQAAKYFVGFGLYQVGNRFISFLSSRADQILISAFLGPEILGYYALAWNAVVQPVYLINPIMTRVFAPILATVQDELARLRRGFLSLIGLTSMINIPLIAGFAAIAPIFVPLIFGAQWAPAIPIMQLLAVVGVVRAIGNPTGALIIARGRPDLGFYWSVISTAVQLPVLYLAVQSGSIIAMTVALAGLQVLTLAGIYWFLHRPLLGPCLRDWLGQVGPPLVFASTMAAAVHLALRLLDLQGLFDMVGLVVLGAILYGGLYGVLRRQAIVDLARTALAR